MSKKKKNLERSAEEISESFAETFEEQDRQEIGPAKGGLVENREKPENTQPVNMSSPEPNESRTRGTLFGFGSLKKASQLSAWVSLVLPLLLPVLWLLTLLSSGDAYALMMKVTIIAIAVNFFIALSGIIAGIVATHNERTELLNLHPLKLETQENTETVNLSVDQKGNNFAESFSTGNLVHYLTPSVLFNCVALGVSVYASLVLVIVTQWPVVI